MPIGYKGAFECLFKIDPGKWRGPSKCDGCQFQSFCKGVLELIARDGREIREASERREQG